MFLATLDIRSTELTSTNNIKAGTVGKRTPGNCFFVFFFNFVKLNFLFPERTVTSASATVE